MIQFRSGVFETNSSSSHSIVVTKDEQPIGMIDPEWRLNDGELDLWYTDDLEFGRSPFDILVDWYGRLRYAIASVGEIYMDEIVAACKRHLKGFHHIKLPKDRYDDGDYYGYVDHQSIGLLRHTLRVHNITLDDFIFNDKYIVIIDGDEYNVFRRLQETVLFDGSVIDFMEEAE